MELHWPPRAGRLAMIGVFASGRQVLGENWPDLKIPETGSAKLRFLRTAGSSLPPAADIGYRCGKQRPENSYAAWTAMKILPSLPPSPFRLMGELWHPAAWVPPSISGK